MSLNYSNLLQPNQKVPSLYASLTQKTPAQTALSKYISPPLIKPPVGSQSVGAIGSSGGYDTAVGINPVKKIENKNTGVTTHYDTATKTKPETKPNQSAGNNSAGTANLNANYFGEYNQQTPQQKQPQIQTKPQTQYASLLDTLQKTATDTSAIDRANQGLLNLRQGYNTAIGNIESTPIPLEFQQGRAQVLGRQFASQEAAAQQALSNELTARGQNIGALQGAAGLAAPRNADIFVDPTTGKVIGGDQTNIGSELAKFASIRAGANTAGNFTADYQTGLANLRAADTIGNQIISTLQANPELNSQPLSAITNLKQLLSGQVSSGPQQLLSQQINQYIQTLGLDSNTVMNIASQQQGTLGQLLDSLRSMAGAQIESKNPQNIINNPTGTQPTSGQGGGQIINTAVGPIDNSWF